MINNMMNILIPETTSNHRLLDSGEGFRLEQFGPNIIARPDTNCVWQRNFPEKWNDIQASYNRDKKGDLLWHTTPKFKEPWHFSYVLPTLDQEKTRKIVCHLRQSQSKNIGIFPEQGANWSWMANIIQSVPYKPQVLNLFGYTGAATLAAAASGADVCHVDASQAAVNLARENQVLSKLEQSEIRWIVDDCSKFVAREIKRETFYDGLIIDPPAFGRDQKGKVFEFEKQIYKLLGLCKQVLKEKPLFVIFNGYSMGYSATVLKQLLQDFFPKENIEFGELHLKEFSSKRTLPCSLYARFTSLK